MATLSKFEAIQNQDREVRSISQKILIPEAKKKSERSEVWNRLVNEGVLPFYLSS
jgi:hypothetical protein